MFGLIVVKSKEQSEKLNQSLSEGFQAVFYGQDILCIRRHGIRPNFVIITCNINDLYRSHLIEALPKTILLEKDVS